MAEEGTLGQARASQGRDDSDVEPSKEELQRRMEEARESITQTVTEIKETVTNQYYSVKETVSDALDWRHHFRQSPIAFSVGALSVGFLVGYGLAGAFKGDGSSSSSSSSDDYPSYEESDVYARTGAAPSGYEDDFDETERPAAMQDHYYAAQSVAANLSAPSENAGGSASEEEQKPGLIERFKGTTAYDRLQTEVSSLGDRFIDELSSTAHKVVLPALFNKIKEMFGVDLSGKQGQGQSSLETKQTGTGGAAQAANAQAASASASSASTASRASSGSSYATSENQGYASQSSEGGSGTAGGNDSVLDLDR
jgi:hypothetical protein